MGGSVDPLNAIQDVIIIGAGTSGINAAYRFRQQLPNINYAILERRGGIGGTWDFFQYPGIRSDSDLFTYAFEWRPWTSDKVLASGDAIRQYMVEAAQETGIDKHIHFHHEVTRASWSSEKQLWTLSCVVDGTTETTFYTRFVFWGSGYYNYKEALATTIPMLNDFNGTVAHPQFWPKDLDYSDMNVVIIGSGATAVTMVPVLAEKAKRVTMVQRTPSYIVALPTVDGLGLFLRRWFPAQFYFFIMRLKFLLLTNFFYTYMRRNPQKARDMIKAEAIAQLPPDFPYDAHFVPPYNVWDQRLCFCPDGDFFKSIREGRADVATGVIETCTPSGLRLTSGQSIDDVDLIVTATGLQIQLLGGARIDVDGEEVMPGERFIWRGLMLQDVPNTGFALGYTMYTWTLGIDTSARLFARIMKDVRKGNYSSVISRVEAKYQGMGSSPVLTISSTYARLGEHLLPTVGTRGPWKTRSSPIFEILKLMFGGHKDGLVFTKA